MTEIRAHEPSPPSLRAPPSPRDRVGRALTRRFGAANVESIAPISTRDNSQVFFVRVGTDPVLELAVKSCLIPHTPSPDVRSTLEQYAALVKVHETLEHVHGVGVPEPVFVDEEDGVFGMSWIDGHSLKRLMHRPAILWCGVTAFEAAGAWLARFHGSGPVDTGTYDFEERLVTIDELLHSPLAVSRFVAAAQLLLKTAPGLADCRVNKSWLHGDCKTDNFFLRGAEVFGIDISMRHENAVEHDLAQFLNDLDLTFADPRYLYLCGLRSSLTRAFWRGYASAGPGVCETFLCWLRLYSALGFWHSTLLQHRRGGVRSWLFDRSFSRLARRLEQELVCRTSGPRRDRHGSGFAGIA